MDLTQIHQSQEHLPENLRSLFFDTSKGVFDINGTTYYYHPHLKTIRNARFQQLSINIGTESTVDYIFNEITAAGEAIINSNSIAESLIKAHTIIYNLQKRIGDIHTKMIDQEVITFVHELCALILVTKDEDTCQINEAVMKKKYADFLESDYAYDAFFFLALNHIADFQKAQEVISDLKDRLREMGASHVDTE